MLHLAGRVAFGMNIGDFLEFECPFEGDRILVATAEEEKILCAHIGARRLLDRLVEFEDFLHFARQGQQIMTSSRQSSAVIVPRAWPSRRVNRYRAASWVVKALVEATPISGPAWV